ncbi:hypothetical protein [Leifsonia sp. NPDC058248]|uniref:hypothetical protein n=1 Tax=Leifsonia sp. NPDC058248 TaxID=3346402 RepID=UPI0036D9A629
MPPGEDYLVREIADLKRQLRELGPSIAASFNSTVDGLNSTIAELDDTVTRLNGLTTVSALGAHINTGNTPGDSTFRWFNSSPALILQTMCPTGKLLVTVGSGQCTLAPGNSSALGLITFAASAPSGWNVARDTVDARVFFVNNTSIGVPLQVNAQLTGVPTNELITITVNYGIWSSSTTTLASADFQSNYVIAQVLAN